MAVFPGMTARKHERVLFVNEPDSGLRAIIAIHNTELGPGLGGVRRWYYENEADALEDVLRLSEAMTYKNAGADLGLGGAKAVIMMNEPGVEFTAEEARAMGDAVQACAGAYLTAEDVGVNEAFMDFMAERCEFVTGGVKHGIGGGDPSPWTARTVVNGMRAALRHLGGSGEFDGVSINILGLGSVGMYMAEQLSVAGAVLRGFDINEERVTMARQKFGVEIVEPGELLTVECDIFAPCALGGVINAENVEAVNTRVICGAANNPLDEPEILARRLAARGIIYAPDFVVNSGGVIRLAGAWWDWDEKEIERRIAGVEETTLNILNRAHDRKATSHTTALQEAKRRIADGCPAALQRRVQRTTA